MLYNIYKLQLQYGMLQGFTTYEIVEYLKYNEFNPIYKLFNRHIDLGISYTFFQAIHNLGFKV